VKELVCESPLSILHGFGPDFQSNFAIKTTFSEIGHGLPKMNSYFAKTYMVGQK